MTTLRTSFSVFSRVSLMALGACVGPDAGAAMDGGNGSDITPGGGTGGAPDGGAPGLNLGAHGGGTQESCDGLDNDDNGGIDENCSCTSAATQACYPSSVVPEGCHMGVQTCDGATWSGATCVGATRPPDGEEACCTVLGDNPTHPIYEAFLSAYPDSAMPKTLAAIGVFAPTVDAYDLESGSAGDPWGEFVDEDGAGVVQASIKAGQDAARELAKSKTMAEGWKVLHDKVGDINIETIGGPPPCNGVGWAWGSLLLETPEQAVREVVYLYVGYCAYQADGERFYYSEGGVEVCQPPVVAK